MAGRKTVRHPSVYEINTRVLLREYGGANGRAQLADIPDGYWIKIAKRGIQWVWLMGIWRIVEKEYDEQLIPQTMMHEFKDLVPGLTEDDIDGSPFAIDAYEVDPCIGDDDQLDELRRKLNSFGMGLMLDFIPNHYGAHTHWIENNADYFLHVDEVTAKAHHPTFYQSNRGAEQYFAHGKDPYFAAWQDTIQVNYANPATRAWMADRLKSVAKRCDGVRCDMAMLAVRHVFNQTWGQFANWRDEQEFWPRAIRKAKEKYPGFTLLAECYWDMEDDVLEMGFDYCYDKRFYDKLLDPADAQQHFQADEGYLMRTARFLENHDEERAASRLHLQQHASCLLSRHALLASGTMAWPAQAHSGTAQPVCP
jgi:glycosidase